MTDRAVTIRLSALDDFTPTFDAFAGGITNADLLTRGAAQSAAAAANAYTTLAGALTAIGTQSLTPPTTPDATTPAIDLATLNAAAGALTLLSDEADDYQRALGGARDEAAQLAAALPDAVAGTAALRGEMTGAEASAGSLRDIIGTLTSQVNEVRVLLRVDDPQNLLGILSANGSIAQVIRDNGGSVPGGDPRTPGGLTPGLA